MKRKLFLVIGVILIFAILITGWLINELRRGKPLCLGASYTILGYQTTGIAGITICCPLGFLCD
jgi:hypothetical protein